MSKIPKEIRILVLIFLPFLLIAVILGAIYAPYLWAPKPKVDFIYSYSEYCQNSRFLVENSKLKMTSKNDGNPCGNNVEAKIYYHNVTENRSREITFAEAEKLNLDNSNKSSDGYILKNKSNSSGSFLFYSSGNSGLYLVKDSLSFEQDLQMPSYYYSTDRFFLAWVK